MARIWRSTKRGPADRTETTFFTNTSGLLGTSDPAALLRERNRVVCFFLGADGEKPPPRREDGANNLEADRVKDSALAKVSVNTHRTLINLFIAMFVCWNSEGKRKVEKVYFEKDLNVQSERERA